MLEKIKQRVLVREFLSQFSTKLHQNLINSSLGNGKCMCKIWRPNVYYFLSYRVHRQTHIHTHTYKPRWLHNLLAEVTTVWGFGGAIVEQVLFISEIVGLILAVHTWHLCEKNQSTLYRKSWVFSGCSGFLTVNADGNRPSSVAGARKGIKTLACEVAVLRDQTRQALK